MAELKTLEVPAAGMDCAECMQHVRHAIAALPGVQSVEAYLTSEKAVVRLGPAQVDLPALRRAVESAGYAIPASAAEKPAASPLGDFTSLILALFGLVFGAVLFIVVIGEWFGLFETITARLPWRSAWPGGWWRATPCFAMWSKPPSSGRSSRTR